MSRSPLQELKSILLRHSLRAHDSTENGTGILTALQTLLRIAEMRYKCCVVEDCSHYAFAQATSCAAQSANQYRPSGDIRASIKRGGDNQCCYSSASAKAFDGDGFSSDIEQTEEDDDESVSSDGPYLSADDGYDADAELLPANIFETDYDESDPIKVNQLPAATSRYRSHIVHEDICRIVIDILIELSQRCLDDPNFWPKYLMQITVRFAPIRESIGGSLYLIKGFTPILQSNDSRLRDFQKSILELITEINTPDTLAAYFSIMTAEQPPIDLLLPRLIYLGSMSYHIQPSNELLFPTINGNFYFR